MAIRTRVFSDILTYYRCYSPRGSESNDTFGWLYGWVCDEGKVERKTEWDDGKPRV